MNKPIKRLFSQWRAVTVDARKLYTSFSVIHRLLDIQVQLYGVCSLSEPVYIIQEYVDKGSLLEFLRKDQGATMTFEDQVFVAYQVASGMAHLESLKFIHRDLAARNVLLGTNNVAKICDFGLARMVKEETYLTLIGSFPIKWTAPEAALRGEFSTKSDVWSFGVFLTELFTFGKPPYEGIPIFSVMDLVKNGYRLPKPPTLPDEIYLRMLLCWHENPERRPNFKALEKYFESMDVTYRSTGTTTDIMVHHNRPKAYDDHRINFVSTPPDEQFEKY